MTDATRRGNTVSRREACARLFVLSWVVAACRQDTRPSELRGLVVDVQIATFTQLQGFSLRTDDGSVYELIVEGDVGISPGHLREHMILGEPVIVKVRYADDLQIATRVDDAVPTP